MQSCKVAKTLTLFVVICLISSPLSVSQTKKPAVRLKVDPYNYDRELNAFLSSCNLYTIIKGRRYFIDYLLRGAVSIPEPLVDPTERYVFYASNIGCTYEAGGITVFVSDVYGKAKLPILGSCLYLRPVKFLTFQRKNYLLITGQSESPKRDFWLYDVSGGKFVLHADGEIREIGKELYSYGYYEGDSFKEIGKVTIGTLIKRRAPLRLLRRYPTHGLTQESDVRVYASELCEQAAGDEPYKTIPRRGTKVVILAECADGGFEIYYEGFRGKVKREAVRTIKFGPKNEDSGASMSSTNGMLPSSVAWGTGEDRKETRSELFAFDI